MPDRYGNPTEEETQRTVMLWCETYKGKYPELELLYHVPNEGKRNYITGGRMKRAGLKKGVPDLVLPVSRGNYHGLYIELKKDSSARISAEQKDWIEKLNKQGYLAIVCRGIEETTGVIEKYIQGKYKFEGKEEGTRDE